MLRWLLVVFLALLLFNALGPWLQRMGIGKLPGDFRFKAGGREWYLPLATTVVLSLLAGLIGKVV